MLDYPSTCRSPQEMFGALAKTYLAEKLSVDPGKIVCVSIMPCTSKKFEANRDELKDGDMQYVDFSLTTREVAAMIKEAGIPFVSLADEKFDALMGETTGASDVFGASGGVMEAALRTCCELLSGKKTDNIEFDDLRGFKGIKEATIDVDGTKLKVAVAHGLKNARKLLEDIKAGTCDYQAIEIMACPAGCINGGGQPYHCGDETVLEKRLEAIYKEDRGKALRRSHENPEVKKLYDEFLGKANGDKAHKLLHTEYIKR